MSTMYRSHVACIVVIAVALAGTAPAQRTDENAVAAAQDAFGTSIGRESIGLYSASNVRGFSPTRAGNARIDGLYFDQVWALSSRLRYEEEFYNGTDALYYNAALFARLHPAPDLDILPFWNRSEGRDDEAGPVHVPAGPFLPPRVERRRFNGPSWADYRGRAENYGALVHYTPADRWHWHAGMFRSLFDDRTSFAHLLVDLQPDGRAHELLYADPPQYLASTSGEVRATRSFGSGLRRHTFHLSARARDRSRAYDGSALTDLGETRLGQPVESGRPDYAFVERTLDGVRQQIFGVAYEGRWLHRGEFGFGLQWTDYEKKVAQPGLPVARTSSRPWLYNATVAVTPTERVAIYASFTRGLEESGVAPESAVNRNQALPAILTRQADMGVRLALRPSLKLIAGLFDVRKPYVGLDADGWYREIGDVVHRGAEISLAGAITPRLDVAAGAVLQQPRVDAHDERLERPGLRPVDQPERVLQLNADWRPARAGPWSFDTTITYRSVAVATTGNDVELPARTLVEVGARYRFAIGRSSAMLRLNLENLFDVFGFESRGSGAYDVLPGRLASAYVAVDW